MPIFCEVIPRGDATPDQLRQLGVALQRWYHQEVQEEGGPRRINQQALRALLEGKLPDVLAVESLVSGEEPTDRRAVTLIVRGGPGYDRCAILHSLRREIAAELVDDILVAGRTWNLPD